MVSCFDVADYFLVLQDEDAGDSISNLKLQKLVYFSQGFHLGIFDKPLFVEQIRAWLHGPVIPVLWKKYSDFDSNSLPLPDTFEQSKFSDEAIELLDEIYEVFGQFSAWKLRDISHIQPPWKKTKRNGVITHRAMKEYFKTQLKEK